MSIDKYNTEIECYNQAVDNENSLSDEILTELQGIRKELNRIGNIMQHTMGR